MRKLILKQLSVNIVIQQLLLKILIMEVRAHIARKKLKLKLLNVNIANQILLQAQAVNVVVMKKTI
ncbi:MAG: hypothetical protein CEE38_20260 [Planctomycetes bacterium B3_Pla]|nr:MAG: hypothetical protein CEE38_20260 [Planctomycetes bacterium B3_Pla]